jgi:hypothetical protein
MLARLLISMCHALVPNLSHELGNLHPLLLVGAKHGILLNVHLIILVGLARVSGKLFTFLVAVAPHIFIIIIHVFYLNIAYIPVFDFTLINVWRANEWSVFVLLPKSTVTAFHDVDLWEPQHRINVKITPSVLLTQARVQKWSSSLREFTMEYQHSPPSHQLFKSLLGAKEET